MKTKRWAVIAGVVLLVTGLVSAVPAVAAEAPLAQDATDAGCGLEYTIDDCVAHVLGLIGEGGGCEGQNPANIPFGECLYYVLDLIGVGGGCEGQNPTRVPFFECVDYAVNTVNELCGDPVGHCLPDEIENEVGNIGKVGKCTPSAEDPTVLKVDGVAGLQIVGNGSVSCDPPAEWEATVCLEVAGDDGGLGIPVDCKPIVGTRREGTGFANIPCIPGIYSTWVYGKYLGYLGFVDMDTHSGRVTVTPEDCIDPI